MRESYNENPYQPSFTSYIPHLSSRIIIVPNCRYLYRGFGVHNISPREGEALEVEGITERRGMDLMEPNPALR